MTGDNHLPPHRLLRGYDDRNGIYNLQSTSDYWHVPCIISFTDLLIWVSSMRAHWNNVATSEHHVHTLAVLYMMTTVTSMTMSNHRYRIQTTIFFDVSARISS